MTSRVCTECGAKKPVEKFRRDSRKPGGYGYVCRECDALRARRARRKNDRPPKKEAHSTGGTGYGATQLPPSASPTVAPVAPPPRINIHFTDRERSIVRRNEVANFLGQMRKTPFAQHWILNMSYHGIIDVVTDYVCASQGCHNRAIKFICWGTSTLEIAPVCINHLNNLKIEEGRVWARAVGINRGG